MKTIKHILYLTLLAPMPINSFAAEALFIKGLTGAPRIISSLNTDTGLVTELLAFDTDARFISGSEPQLNPETGRLTWQSFTVGGDAFLHTYDPATNTLKEVDIPNDSFSLGGLINEARNNLIRKADDGSIHIGENSLVTIERDGRQSLFAQDANGNPIDIDINNGSDLLVNGTSVMGSIRGLGEGLKATTAMNAAFSAVPALSIESQYECGMGAGGYDNKHAIAASCGFRASENTTFNLGLSHLTSGSESYLIDNLPSYVVRAGFSFRFGGKYKKHLSTVTHPQQNRPSRTHATQQDNKRLVELEEKIILLRLNTEDLQRKTLELNTLKAETAGLRQQLTELKQLVTQYASIAMRTR
jgi:hypothetical protein